MSPPADVAAAIDAAAARLRASRIVLFLGVAELLLFGALAFTVHRAAGMSVDELKSIAGGSMSRPQVEAIHPQLRWLAAALAVFGVLPAGVIVVCSAAVRRGSTAAAVIVMLIAATQFFVLGALLLRQVLVAIGNADPPMLSISALAIGTPMAFLVFVIRSLMQLAWPRGQVAMKPGNMPPTP